MVKRIFERNRRFPMSKSHNALERKMEAFLDIYGESLQALMDNLNEAGISHYSSGCGVKNVTFNIFPAAAYIAELLAMISLDRSHKSKVRWGFKDASSQSNYNPGHEFIHYLRRWSHFAEQVMKNEGDAPRGVAAARAKLIMGDLIERLTLDSQQVSKANIKALPRSTDLSRVMQEIGLLLESRQTDENNEWRENGQHSERENYARALAAAQGVNPDEAEEAIVDDVQAVA
jgi:hypothetical protein